MRSLLIVYHSQSGASAQLAQACFSAAASVAEVEVRLLRAWDAGSADLLAADGLVLVGAENSGSLSGGIKDFLDRTFYPVGESGRVLPYGLLLSAGNDGRGAREQARRILSGYPLTPALEPVICRGEVTTEHRRQAAEMGEAFATGLEMGIF
ncbi:flavodoxin [Haliea sp. E1-2-M8]|uniref:flavodoxin n=1 Tax=Haliea sp. E1-2-M8 TaxID=3064706 RepID=UPI002716421B|nr:flavodoxin [Haliea sp. E1-2-M8]MDO8862877.1 flavodoxin [Haliea sp. E1-2-M8]